MTLNDRIVNLAEMKVFRSPPEKLECR